MKTPPMPYPVATIPQKLAADIRLLVMDVDGVMTNGHLFYAAHGQILKAFAVQDGQGIKQLHHHNIPTAIISAGDTALVRARARDIGITKVILGCEDKYSALCGILKEWNIATAHTAYIGDDIPDLPVLEKVGLAVTVPNAHPSVLAVVQYVTKNPGGSGAVRELCDQLISARETL